MKKFTLIFIAVLMIAGGAFAGTRHNLVKKGNKAYSKEDWGNAIAKYQEAEQKGSLPVIDYNMGDAFYKSGSYDKAAENYLKSLNGADNKTKASALHNLGNAFLKGGKMQEAISAYKNSLKLNPGDMETKQNLEYCLRQMQKQQNQNQDQNQQDQQKQDKQDQQKQQQQEQQDKQKQQQQQQQQQAQQDKKDQMSEENAKKMLDAMKNDEKQVQQKVMKLKMAGRKPKGKNW